MTDCQRWLTELTHDADRILDEDLAALKRRSRGKRIEQYEQIAEAESEFQWEFTKDCSGFLTRHEETTVRGELRLARLLLAASFYADEELPGEIEGDFIEAELQAVVDFDRFKQFDVLDEQQIEKRVRRMDGDLAELIEEYAATQIANIDELLDNPEVQQDVIERLLERYETRRERIRHGVLEYAETHGLEEMAANIDGELAVDTAAETDGQREPQPEPADDKSGTDVVTRATARLFEMDYLGRFETTMYETETIELPEETFSVPESYWDDRKQRRDQADQIASFGNQTPDSMPVNPTLRFEITESKYFGLSSRTRMAIEATVHSHLSTHAKQGYDAEPAGVDDLLTVVDRAGDTETPTLIGIASPTGWTDEVIQHVREDELSRTRYSRQVSVCLIDLRHGALIYDDTDPVVTENTGLFERAVHAESVANCAKQLREEYLTALGRDTVLLTEVVDDTDFDRHVVKQAFARLEENGDAEQFYLEESGVALDFSA